MAFERLSTRLETVLATAQRLRSSAVYFQQRFAGSNVPASEVVSVAGLAKGCIDSTLPYQGDASLVAYAGQQFAGQNWVPLDQQLAGGILLCQSLIAACRSCLQSAGCMDAQGNLTVSSLASDGTVNSTLLSPAQTQVVRDSLATIVASIPE